VAEPPEPAEAPPEEAAKPERLLSLDALRGLTILLMLLVNNVALDTYTPPQLTHAPWNGGVRVADLVFPWFLFCVGIAIPFSARSFRKKGLPAWRYDLKVVTRSAVLVLLGCLLTSSLYKRPIFSLGVLQIIGMAYLVGALLYDFALSRRLAIAAALLVAYWAIIRFVPIPGVGPGVFEESRNIIKHFNDTYLTAVSLRGLPSVIPTAALVLIGTALGDLLLREEKRPADKTAWLLAAGLAMTGAGLLWDLDLGFNKALWTPSYILFAAGTGSIALGLLYLTIDAQGWRRWAYPLIVFGSNAIVAYVVPILAKVWVLQEWQVRVPGGQTKPILQWLLDACITKTGRIPGGWLYTIGYIAAWWAVLWLLYRKRLFLRV
jgi:predicted acyltransferase